MARQYDRYGFNRQYRRNASRKRNPFPYRLPFTPGFSTRAHHDPDAVGFGPIHDPQDVSVRTAHRYRQVINDLLEQVAKEQRLRQGKRGYDLLAGRNAHHEILSGSRRKWQHMQDTKLAAEFLKDRQVPTNNNDIQRKRQRIMALQCKHFNRFKGVREFDRERWRREHTP